jgi:hypothetical protein
MRPRVFLHVGSPKTGTTFLQNLLWAQRDLAREQGLLLPMERFHDHYLATLDVRGLIADPIYPRRAVGMWDRIAAEAREWPGTVLVSHELFAGADAEQASRAVAALGTDAEVHVVLTVRDLVRQISAEWQEHVKHRATTSFEQFVAGLRADSARTSWFWQVQDFASVLERWGTGLPAERLHVVTVPPSGTDPTVLWDRFATLLGLDPSSFDTELERSNTSLGLEQAELLRRVNAALGDRLPLPGPYPAVVKNVLAHEVLEPRQGTRLALSAADTEYAVAESRAIADRLRAAGVDVVGDLDELVPDGAVTGAGGEAYVVPPPERLLDESVATIADLLVVLNQRRAAVQRADDTVQTAREKPIRFALVQAAENRPLLRKLRGGYRRIKARVRSGE